MLACLDVSYRGDEALSTAVLFLSWTDVQPIRELTACVQLVALYVSSEFYKRELPCLLAVLAQVDASLETMVTEIQPGQPGRFHITLVDRACQLIG
jgi:deoxyribonuclease V